MTFKEYLKEKAIPWEMIHLLSSSKCYEGTDEKILYVSLPENYDSPGFLVLSKRLSVLVNKRAIFLTEAEVSVSDEAPGLICPKQKREHLVVDEATRSRLTTFLQESFLDEDHYPGDYLALRKIDFSPKFGNYEFETVYYTDYDEYVGSTKYPIDEKTLRPKDFETHYLFDATEIRNDNAVNDFVQSIERVISALKIAPNAYLQIMKKVDHHLIHHSRTGTLQLNLVMGFVKIIRSDTVDEYDEGKSIGEYYIDIENLIYDQLEEEIIEYGEGPSIYSPSPCYVQQFIISSLEDYYNCHLYVPQFWGDHDPVFMEWYE